MYIYKAYVIINMRNPERESALLTLSLFPADSVPIRVFRTVGRAVDDGCFETIYGDKPSQVRILHCPLMGGGVTATHGPLKP